MQERHLGVYPLPMVKGLALEREGIFFFAIGIYPCIICVVLKKLQEILSDK